MSVNRVISVNEDDFPISEILFSDIGNSDIGKCDDLPISERDLPISEIRITDIGICRINVHMTPNNKLHLYTNMD